LTRERKADRKLGVDGLIILLGIATLGIACAGYFQSHSKDRRHHETMRKQWEQDHPGERFE
jgi:hypothetical protein